MCALVLSRPPLLLPPLFRGRRAPCEHPAPGGAEPDGARPPQYLSATRRFHVILPRSRCHAGFNAPIDGGVRRPGARSGIVALASSFRQGARRDTGITTTRGRHRMKAYQLFGLAASGATLTIP